MKKLHRPLDATLTDDSQLKPFLDALVQAFDDLGIEPGDSFVIGGMDARSPESLSVRTNDPDTSKLAAAANFPRRGSQRHKCLLALAKAGDDGLTTEQVGHRTGILYRSVSPRIGELKNSGWVMPIAGKVRATTSGENADVLTLTEKGWSELGIKHPPEFFGTLFGPVSPGLYDPE